MSSTAKARRLSALIVALAAVIVLYLVAAWWRDTKPLLVSLGQESNVTDAQDKTIDMVKELNGYLISMTTLLFGGLGWYLTKHPRASTFWVQAFFFGAAACLVVSFWQAAMTYAEMTSELGQNVIGLIAGKSRVLYHLELELMACGAAAILILAIFADSVTMQRS